MQSDIQRIVDLVMASNDKQLGLYISPDGSCSITIKPWPSAEDVCKMASYGVFTMTEAGRSTREKDIFTPEDLRRFAESLQDDKNRTGNTSV